MENTNTFILDTKCALTCIVPPINEIQSVRALYDSAYERWMPHFNICFPFVDASQHHLIMPILHTICKKYDSMTIKLTKINNFACKSRTPGTLYAEVHESTGKLSQLYDELMRALSLKKADKFIPHVTLGRFTSQSELQRVQNSITWIEYEFQLDGLDLITRDADTPFAKKYFFNFGARIDVDTTQQIISQKYNATVCNFDDYYIFKISNNNSDCEILDNSHKSNICNFLVIDNSGSMGHYTKLVTERIGKHMINLGVGFDNVNILPAEIILFSEDVHIISNIRSESMINDMEYPRQSMTNIKKAITTAIERIIRYDSNFAQSGKNHYILTFLSDGEHNSGNKITDFDLNKMRSDINRMNIKLSIIVVGIMKNDTSLGMKIKTQLETVTINTLKSVYYAASASDMDTVLKQLLTGCQECLTMGSTVKLNVENGLFIENLNSSVSCFITKENIFAVKSLNRDILPILKIGDEIINTTVVDCCENDVSQVVDSMLPKLSQIRVAYGSSNIVDKISTLNAFIDTADAVLVKITQLNNKKSSDVDNIGKNKMKPFERLTLLKKIRQSQISFQEERNKLKLLLAQVSNDSHHQAEYLDGFNKKYAAKAVTRSATYTKTTSEMLSCVDSILHELKTCLENDVIKDDTTSILSLNTAHEQLQEWLSYDKTQFTDIYSLLVHFGFSCYPVKFTLNNAVQMDPFQTACEYIEPFMIDTCNLMLSNQLGHQLSSPSRTVFTDGIILLSPSTISSFKILMKTPIYQCLCSVTLCRDLYMFHPKMTFATHAHALIKSIENYYTYNSKAYLDLALKIVYSYKNIGEKNNILFNHWWNNWETITQSQDDNCNHPVQLLLLLACADNESKSNNFQTPLVNLLNEYSICILRRF